MELDSKIIKIVKKARKRLCGIQFFKSLMFFVTLGFIAFGTCLLAALFVPFYARWNVGIALFFVIVITGIIITVIRYPSTKEAAMRLDARGFKERFTTSMELKGRNDVFSTIQKQDALAKVEGISLKKVFPLRVKKRMLIFFFLSLMYVVSMAFIPAKAIDEAEEQHIIQEEIKEVVSNLEDLKAELVETHDLSPEEIEQLDKYLEEAKEELEECEDLIEIEKVKERFEDKMYAAVGEDPVPQNEREAQAIQNALESMTEGQDFTQKDQEEIAERLDKLAQQNQEQELQETAEQMQQELKENGEISQETIDKAQEQLEQYLNEQQHGGQQQQGGQGQQQNGQNGEQGQQQGGQQQAGQSEQQGGQSGQGQQQGGQNGEQGGGQGSRQSGNQFSVGGEDQQPGGSQGGRQQLTPGQQQQGQDQGQQPGGGQQNGQQQQPGGGDQQQGDGNQKQPGGQQQQPGGGNQQQPGGGQQQQPGAGQQQGEGQQPGGEQGGQGQQPGEGQQGGQGQQPGAGQQPGDGQQGGSSGQNGQGQGTQDKAPTGSKIGNETPFYGQGDGESVMTFDDDLGPNQNLTGKANQNGDSQKYQSDKTKGYKGTKNDYKQVIGEYSKKAYDNMNQSNIPDSMKDLVKNYFSNLN